MTAHVQIEPHHVGLTVMDLDHAKAWYAAAFGFAAQLEFTLPNGVRGAMLRSDAGARVELFEVADAGDAVHHADPATAMRARGFGHVAFACDDIAAAFQTALEAGAAAVWEPRASPEPGVLLAFLHDPEGNLIELVGPQL